MEFFLEHWSKIRGSDTMRNVWQQIRLGRHPGFEEGMRISLWIVVVRLMCIVSVASHRGEPGVQAERPQPGRCAKVLKDRFLTLFLHPQCLTASSVTGRISCTVCLCTVTSCNASKYCPKLCAFTARHILWRLTLQDHPLDLQCLDRPLVCGFIVRGTLLDV